MSRNSSSEMIIAHLTKKNPLLDGTVKYKDTLYLVFDSSSDFFHLAYYTFFELSIRLTLLCSKISVYCDREKECEKLNLAKIPKNKNPTPPPNFLSIRLIVTTFLQINAYIDLISA